MIEKNESPNYLLPEDSNLKTDPDHNFEIVPLVPIEDIEEVVSALEESKNSGFVQNSFLMDQSIRETNLQKIEEEFQESLLKLQR